MKVKYGTGISVPRGITVMDRSVHVKTIRENPGATNEVFKSETTYVYYLKATDLTSGMLEFWVESNKKRIVSKKQDVKVMRK